MLNTNSKPRSAPLTVFGLVMINIIAIDSLRNLPSNAAMGPSLIFFYILATLFFMIPCALVTAELATHRPITGGAYVWVRDAFGPFWGFFTIWLQWIYNVVWYPTILSFIAANIAYLVDPNLANQKLYMIAMIIGMFSLATFVNWFGMKTSSWVSTLGALVGTLFPMFFIIALGLAWYISGKPSVVSFSWHTLFPDVFHHSSLAFLVVVFFSLMGLEMSAVHAEAVKDPQKDFSKALLYSAWIIVISLIFSSLAIALIVPTSTLNILTGLDQAFTLFLAHFHLQWLRPIVIFAIVLGGFCGMAAWVIGPTKSLVVAAEDQSLPKIFSARNSNGVPVTILLLQWVIVIALCTLFYFYKFISESYWILSDLTAQLALIFYILFFAAAIRLRYKTHTQERAFRIPGGNWGIWIVGIVGILSCLIVILLGFLVPDGVPIENIKRYEWSLVIGIILFSLPPFLIYAWQKRNS
jgi:amino acid transporter